MDSLLRHRSLVQETAALRSGADDPVAAARRTCDRIDAVEPHLLAFVPEPDRRTRLTAAAERTAAAWADAPAKPPLYGVPVGVKDIIRADGLPTRAGSALPPGVLAGPQAAVVDRLAAAGALVAGKTVTAEFAVTAPGPTRNPHDVAHTPGGSSSGSAAAVAAGMVPLALGTQTVGSMIRPAAYCGVTGFKPTFGRVPTAGVIPNAVSFDTVGWYAQDVAGVTLAASALCDGWPSGPPPSGPPPVLGVPVGPYLRRADDEALAALRAQQVVLRRAGYPVVEVPVMEDFEEIVTQLFTMNRYEVARAHTEWYARFGDLYREQTANALHEGHAVTDAAYARARQRRTEFRARLEAARQAAGVDLWISPAATGPAPFGLSSTGTSVMCLPWSNAGLPSVSLPAGRAANGLPLGLQLVGPPGSDPVVLAWAAGVEEALSADGAAGGGGAAAG
ncbi:amidase [Streptomyces sp. BBFR2]|uniref:amidase n=1 Tax=Streptomyces sp. BBFR2 TaxID=3372854 RepID=UPI0037D9AA8C